jgi:outer membrane immunogenic protein
VKCFKTVAAVVLLASVSSFAGIDLAIGGGLNMSNATLTKDYGLPSNGTKSMVMGFNAGANARFAFNEQMGVVAGVNYETRGVKTDDGTYKKTYSSNYLQIPLLFSYKIIPELAVNIGPEFGIFLSGKYKEEAYGMSGESNLEKVSTLDLGASVQVNYTIINMIVVGAGYYYGFLKPDNNSDYMGSNMKEVRANNNIKITLAYLLKL